MRVGSGEELRTLKECGYSYPEATLSDLREARALFSDLRLHTDFYCFPNKEKKKLVFLAGTLPVQFEGSGYNFPVCIWLHETHPLSPPRCLVCPSVSMVINPMCCCVDEVSGNIRLPVLSSWTQGVSSLSLLMSEMRQAFQKDTPLYARCPVQAPPPAADVNRPRPISPQRTLLFLNPPHLSAQKGSQWEQSRRSYAEELQGIDFSCPAPSDPLSRGLEALSLDPQQVGSPVRTGQSGANIHTSGYVDLLPAAADHIQMAAGLPQDQKTTFLSLLKEGRGFRPAEVLEAVQLSPDYPSALRFLTHCCPLCQEQVTFSKIISMTHCSCFLCESCFKAFFSSAIKEKSIDQLTCPQCGRPEVGGQGGGMEYFNLLDTQIRHFLPPQTHELFQRKLRDRALQEMPNFIWCSHCSFGILHEADRLKMDCPSCKKSTCCQCRSPWSPEHQGVSCQQFRVRQHQNQPDLQNQNPPLLECPGCSSVFSVSRGGCLHFTCSQCQHQFCGGCRQTFSPGAACRFSTSCGGRGLHAHHPRDCLYHLRDWRVTRLLLLLQFYRVSPSGCDSAPLRSPDSHTGVCPVMEMREEREEACGRAAPPQYRGYCESHFKECLVQLINRCHGDPAVLFSVAEMGAELQRWGVAVPTRRAEEAEPEYTERLRAEAYLTAAVSPPPHRHRPIRRQHFVSFLLPLVMSSSPIKPVVSDWLLVFSERTNEKGGRRSEQPMIFSLGFLD